MLWELVIRINAEVNRILVLSVVQEQLKKFAVHPSPRTSAQFTSFFHDDQMKWPKVIKDTNIRAEQ